SIQLVFDQCHNILLAIQNLFLMYTATTNIYTLSLHDALPISKMQDSQKRNGANGKGAASALIYNLDTLARVLRPVVTPERLLGWSLGIVYLWFGALSSPT